MRGSELWKFNTNDNTAYVDHIRVAHDRLLEIVDASAFLGLPRMYNLRADGYESFVTRDMMIGNVPIVASYYVREDDLMLYAEDTARDEYGAIKHFWHGRKPDWIETSEDLAEFAAARLIEHLTEQDYHKEE